MAHTLGWSHLPAVTTSTTFPVMGRGLGFQAELRTSSMLHGVSLDAAEHVPTIGMAAYQSVDDVRQRALLVVGLSLLPGTTAAMAVLAEQMALHSTFRDADPDGT